MSTHYDLKAIWQRIDELTAEERRTVDLAIGRIFRLGSRPTQPGDVAEYERCRAIIMDLLAPAAA